MRDGEGKTGFAPTKGMYRLIDLLRSSGEDRKAGLLFGLLGRKSGREA